MAVYQFYLALIPKVGLISKHRQVPDTNEITIANGCFYDNTETYWALANIPAAHIMQVKH
jgi:hypothetical protein